MIRVLHVLLWPCLQVLWYYEESEKTRSIWSNVFEIRTRTLVSSSFASSTSTLEGSIVSIVGVAEFKGDKDRISGRSCASCKLLMTPSRCVICSTNFSFSSPESSAFRSV